MDSSNIYSIRQMLFSCQQGVEGSVTTASVFPQALIAEQAIEQPGFGSSPNTNTGRKPVTSAALLLLDAHCYS